MHFQDLLELKNGDLLYISQGTDRGKKCLVEERNTNASYRRILVKQLETETYKDIGWSKSGTRIYSYAALSLRPVTIRDKSTFELVLVYNKKNGELWSQAFDKFEKALEFYDNICLGGPTKQEIEKINVPGCSYFKEDEDRSVRIMTGSFGKD